jgi:AcrR family transcriptional regulator
MWGEWPIPDLQDDPDATIRLTYCQIKVVFGGGIVDKTESGQACKRPYDLGKRQEQSSRTRELVLEAARVLLESGGVRDLTMEALARASGVTRQTIHNLFGTKTGVLEALFDRLAIDAGMMGMREVMTASDVESMLAAFVEVFTSFWVKDRLLLKRIHGFAAIDAEVGKAVAARNQRRQMAAARVVERLYAGELALDGDEKRKKIASLVALTSFEFFDALAQSCGSVEVAAGCLYTLVKKAVAP